MTKRNRVTVFLAAASLLLPLSAAARQKSKQAGSMSHSGDPDHTFAMKAAEGSMAEIQFGQLAQQKASSDAVKQFGQRMVNDHTKASSELKDIAGRKNLTLPADMSAADKAEYDRLSKLSGKDFDRAYVQYMMRDHHKDMTEFDRQSKNGRDQELKDFASRTLPTIQDHYNQAQQIAQQEGIQASHAKHGSTTRTSNKQRSSGTERTTNPK